MSCAFLNACSYAVRSRSISSLRGRTFDRESFSVCQRVLRALTSSSRSAISRFSSSSRWRLSALVSRVEGRRFDLHPRQLAGRLVDLGGHRVHFHPQAARRFVDQVDRLVGQEAVVDVAVGKRRGGDQRIVGDPHAVVRFVALFQAAQDRDRVFDARFLHHHRLEPPLEGRVLLDVFAIFVERGRADAVQFAAGQGRLEQVRGVHRPFGRPRPDDGVQFVDKEDDPSLRFLHFAEDGLQPVLELSAVFRPGDQGPHVERDDPLVLEVLRHVAHHDAVRQPFDNRRLADARLADQDRVVFPPPGKDLDHAADLGVAADDRIDLPLPGHLDQVGRVTLQGLVLVLRILVDHLLGAAHRLERGQHVGLADAVQIEQPLRLLARLRERQQQMLGRDEGVLHLVGKLLRLFEHLHGRRSGGRLHVRAADFGQPVQLGGDHRLELADVGPDLLDQRPHDPLVLVQEGLEQVQGRATADGRSARRFPGRAAAPPAL